MRNEKLFIGLFIFLLLLIQVSLKGILSFFHFEVFIIFVVILSFRTSYYESLSWSFYAGLLQDLFSAGPALGVYTFTAVIISFTINIFKDILMLKTLSNLVFFVFIASIIELSITRLLYSIIFNVKPPVLGSTLIQFILPSVLNTLIAIPVFMLIKRVQTRTQRKIWSKI